MKEQKFEKCLNFDIIFMVRHMKVKNINKSSIQTDEIIKQAFAELVNETDDYNTITVTSLIKRAGVSRSSFYTHYESIKDLAHTLQRESLNELTRDLNPFTCLDDIYNYIDNFIKILKDNKRFYHLILTSKDCLHYSSKIIESLNNKLLEYNKNTKEMEINFCTYGFSLLIIKAFNDQKYTLDEIGSFMKKTITNLV